VTVWVRITLSPSRQISCNLVWLASHEQFLPWPGLSPPNHEIVKQVVVICCHLNLPTTNSAWALLVPTFSSSVSHSIFLQILITPAPPEFVLPLSDRAGSVWMCGWRILIVPPQSPAMFKHWIERDQSEFYAPQFRLNWVGSMLYFFPKPSGRAGPILFFCHNQDWAGSLLFVCTTMDWTRSIRIFFSKLQIVLAQIGFCKNLDWAISVLIWLPRSIWTARAQPKLSPYNVHIHPFLFSSSLYCIEPTKSEFFVTGENVV